MKKRLLLLLAILVLATTTAQAGIFDRWKKRRTPKTPPTPEQHVAELLQTIQADGDDHNRSRAIEDLRQYDASKFPRIVPALIRVLMQDKRSSVRAEAAQTLGRIRPVNQRVGQALEYARKEDSSMRVRLQARSSLLNYQWHGYKTTGDVKQPPIQTKEPPLAGPQKFTPPPTRYTTSKVRVPQPIRNPNLAPVPVREVGVRPTPPPVYETAAPPVIEAPAPPVLNPSPRPNLQPLPVAPVQTPGYRPLPVGPDTAEPPIIEGEGPSLNPPTE